MTVSMPLLCKPVDQKTGLRKMFIFEKKNLAFELLHKVALINLHRRKLFKM